MDGSSWIFLVEQAKSTIDIIAVVVIPLEILILTLAARKWLFNDAYTNVVCAGFIGLSLLLTGGGVAKDALALVGQWQWWQMELNWATVLLHVLVGDLCFYWFHRLAHSPLFFWLDLPKISN